MQRSSTRLASAVVGIGMILGSVALVGPAAHASTTNGATGTHVVVHATTLHEHTHLRACRSLAVTLGVRQGAAGSTLQTIRFRNTSNRACRMHGYPGVHDVSVTKMRIGVRAVHARQTVKTIRLAPGKVARAILQVPEVGNFSPAACKPEMVAMLKVRAGHTRTLLPWSQIECSTKAGRAAITPYRR